jgi:hypothetical protein
MVPAHWFPASWVTGWWGKGAAWVPGSLLGRWRDAVAALWVAGLLLGLPFLSNDQLGVLLLGGVGHWGWGCGCWNRPQGFGGRRWCTG